ncbi:hypothetical protein FGIG_08178, partial [Fasciola gigantica]
VFFVLLNSFQFFEKISRITLTTSSSHPVKLLHSFFVRAGNWICPICTPHVFSKDRCFPTPDPRLEAIRVCDQLTQHEINWMQQELTAGGKSPSDNQSPSSVDSSARKNVRQRVARGSKLVESSTPRPSITPTVPVPTLTTASPAITTLTAPSKLEEYPNEQTGLQEGSSLIPKDESAVRSSQQKLKQPKRLVQKSLTTWAVAQPQETVVVTGKTESPEQPVERESIRPRRTSAAASLVWQSLVKRNLNRRPRSQTTPGRLSQTVAPTRDDEIKIPESVQSLRSSRQGNRWSLSRVRRRISTQSILVRSRASRRSLLSRSAVAVPQIVESSVATTIDTTDVTSPTLIRRRSRSSK